MIEEQVKDKLLEALDEWCTMFMIMGFPHETPRYSQILQDYDTDEYLLKSTVSHVWHKVDLTDEEVKFLRSKQKRQELWGWWKSIRTNHLVNSYPTISAY